MKIDVTVVLQNFDGVELLERRIKPGQEEKPEPELEVIKQTLRSICCQALMSTPENERLTVAGSKRVERFFLAQKIHDNDRVELKAEEIADLKQLINKGFNTPAVAAAFMLLDGAEAKRAAEAKKNGK